VGWGSGGRGSAGADVRAGRAEDWAEPREPGTSRVVRTAPMRTAKPCGPGRRRYGQAFAEAALVSTGAVPVNSVRWGRPEGIRLPGEHGI